TVAPGAESSQNQTRKQATMRPIVTKGNVLVGTLSRSGITGREHTPRQDLTRKRSGFILAYASGTTRTLARRHDGNTGSLGALLRARLAPERDEPLHERAARGQRADDPELDPDRRRLGDRGRGRLRVRLARH